MKFMKYEIGKFYQIAFICCLICSSTIAQQIKISLHVENLTDPPGKFIGISNLFFEKIDSTINFSFPSKWKNIEQDQLIRDDAMEPVYIFRVKGNDGAYEYYADLNNDKKITKNERLILKN